MFGIKKLAHHADLMTRMADTVGADVPHALQSGALSPYELRAAALRCTHCKQADDCPHWMDTHQGASEAPAYCENHNMLARLSHQKN